MSTTSTTGYRPVPVGKALCPACEEPFALIELRTAPGFTNRHGFWQRPRVIPVHGPRKNRCTGSHGDPMPWLEATRLPDWDDLTDLDKGAALLHVWKCYWEKNAIYARDHYPAIYHEHPDLVGLDAFTSSYHATRVAGSWVRALERLGEAEVWRLYSLTLRYEEQARHEVRDGGRSDG